MQHVPLGSGHEPLGCQRVGVPGTGLSHLTPQNPTPQDRGDGEGLNKAKNGDLPSGTLLQTHQKIFFKNPGAIQLRSTRPLPKTHMLKVPGQGLVSSTLEGCRLELPARRACGGQIPKPSALPRGNSSPSRCSAAQDGARLGTGRAAAARSSGGRRGGRWMMLIAPD